MADLRQFFVRATRGRGLVLFWRRCDMLYVFLVLWMTHVFTYRALWRVICMLITRQW